MTYFQDLVIMEVVALVWIMEIIFIIVRVTIEFIWAQVGVPSMDLRDMVNIGNNSLIIIQMQMMIYEMKMELMA